MLVGPMYETEAWSRGLRLDEAESWFEEVSLAMVVVWSPGGRIVWEQAASAAARREAAVRARQWGGTWSEADYWELHPPVVTSATAVLPAEVGVDQGWDGALGGGVFDPLAGLSLLTAADRCEFSWEPVGEALEERRREVEAQWVEARVTAETMLVGGLEELMMEVPGS